MKAWSCFGCAFDSLKIPDNASFLFLKKKEIRYLVVLLFLAS